MRKRNAQNSKFMVGAGPRFRITHAKQLRTSNFLLQAWKLISRCPKIELEFLFFFYNKGFSILDRKCMWTLLTERDFAQAQFAVVCLKKMSY